MKRSPITARGAERLRATLQQLKSVERPRIIRNIAEARAHGDLKENAEYHAAREEQGFVEARIADMENQLSNAQIIAVESLNAAPRVVFGATVRLCDEDSGEEVRYQIVGDLESDIEQGLISISSPIARALIGSEEGDSITVEAPSGERNYEILSVEYI